MPAEEILEIVEVVDRLSLWDESRSISAKFPNIGYTDISDRYTRIVWLSEPLVWVFGNIVRRDTYDELVFFVSVFDHESYLCESFSFTCFLIEVGMSFCIFEESYSVWVLLYLECFFSYVSRFLMDSPWEYLFCFLWYTLADWSHSYSDISSLRSEIKFELSRHTCCHNWYCKNEIIPYYYRVIFI